MGANPFCVVWRDTLTDELGFRIELRYISQSDPTKTLTFNYEVPANVTELVFPDADGPHQDDRKICLQRDAYTVEVWARTASGEVLVDATATVIHCGSR